jgi:hypothetical protein
MLRIDVKDIEQLLYRRIYRVWTEIQVLPARSDAVELAVSMKSKFSNPLMTLAWGVALFCLLSSTSRSADSGMHPLFNGKDLTGWKVPDPNPFWKVQDGVLIGENDEKRKGHVLFTEKEFKDFVIETDVRWSGEIDSGIMLRKPELQLQLGISRSLKKDMSCSFYTGKYPEAGQAHDVEKLWKPDAWNKVKLQAKGDVFTVWLNGQKVCEFTDPKYKDPAPIGLQIHPGLKMKVEYRNVTIKELD